MHTLGIIQDKSHHYVPGTSILNEADDVDVTFSADVGLRRGTGKNSHVVLIPQPTDDPNDPLNWSYAKKLTIVVILGFGTCLNAATLGPLLNAGLASISAELGVEIGSITLMSGYQLLVAGAFGPFVSALSRKYGKRPCFVFSSFFGLVGSIVGSTCSTYNGLFAARVVQGLAISAYESLIISGLGDLYFVHERGAYTSAVQFLLGGVSNFSSVVTGIVTTNLRWKYLFHLCVLFTGIQLVLLLLFCPETTYKRENLRATTEVVAIDLKSAPDVADLHVEHVGGEMVETPAPDHTRSPSSHTEPPPPAKTFSQQMAILTGKYSEENLVQLVLAPFAVCSNVAVLWVVVVSGTITAAYVAQAYVLAQVFTLPPYNLNAAGVGYLSFGPFIGGIIGTLFIGLVLDPSIKWLSKLNKGVYEPEFRLWIMLGGLVTGGGLMAWGYMIESGANIYACVAMHGVVLFGVICVTIATSAYALDAYREMSNEIFMAGMVLKNFLFYGFSYFVNSWTATAGPAEVFYVFGGVVFGLTLTAIPIYVFGKKYRHYWFHHNLLEKFSLKTHAEE